MVLQTPESNKIFALYINVASYRLFVIPIFLFLLFWWLWNLKRANVKILIAFLGAALLTVGVAQISSMGWVLWSLPSLILLISRSSKRTLLLFLFWQVLELISFIYSSGSLIMKLNHYLFWGVNEKIISINFTISVIISTILILKLLNETLAQGDPLSLNSHPLSVLIAGDSGVGKDTLSNSIAKTFGENLTVHIKGDDYHLHERANKIWNKITHLNPIGNDLQLLAQNFNRATSRKSFSFREYDHASGKFTEPKAIQIGDLVILNGLHPFGISTSHKADLKIYLEMEDELRNSLKFNRDANYRNRVFDSEYLQQIENRKLDYEYYILPQKKQADLIFRTEKNANDISNLITKVSSSNTKLLQNTLEIFEIVTGKFAFEFEDGDGLIWFSFSADQMSVDQNSEILNKLVPDAIDLFPDWEENPVLPGNIGFMTVVSIVHLFHQRLGKR